MNKYLEKIAAIHDMGDGFYYDFDKDRTYITPAKANEIDAKSEPYNRKEGAKLFGGLGAFFGGALGAELGPKSRFKGQPGAKAAVFRGVAGAVTGGTLGAALGNYIGGKRKDSSEYYIYRPPK